MRKRVLRMHNKALDLKVRRLQEARREAQQKLGLTAEQAEGFIQLVKDIEAGVEARDGVTLASLRSDLRQYGNRYRPALQVSLLRPHPALDAVLMQQAVYTDNKDTAVDTNYALRFPAETELIMRRLTVGDLLLLEAAHTLEWKNGNDDAPYYWASVWSIITQLCFSASVTRIPNGLPVGLINDTEPYRALMVACSFFLDCPAAECTVPNLVNTFFNPFSIYDLGIDTNQERMRVGDRYHDQWSFHFRNPEGDIEGANVLRAYEAACLVLCYTLDCYERRGYDTSRRDNPVTIREYFPRYVDRHREVLDLPFNVTHEGFNGNQEAENSPPGNGGSDVREGGAPRGEEPVLTGGSTVCVSIHRVEPERDTGGGSEGDGPSDFQRDGTDQGTH